MQEMRVPSLGRADPLEKDMTTHSSHQRHSAVGNPTVTHHSFVKATLCASGVITLDFYIFKMELGCIRMTGLAALMAEVLAVLIGACNLGRQNF